MLGCAGPAVAQQSTQATPPSPPTTQDSARQDDAIRLRSLLDDLADPDAGVRARARIALMGMSRSELALFRQVVADARPLLASQLAVLREIVSHVYAAHEPYDGAPEHGFIGVELAPVDLGEFDDAPFIAGGAVVIRSRLLGFVGFRYLLEGDVVIGIGGENPVPFRIDGQLAQTVRNVRAGTPVPLQVLRQGRLIEVTIPLDVRPAELDVAGRLEPTRLQRELAADAYWKREFAPLVEPGLL